MKINVSAPSNIALIKYMGKTDTQTNLPLNSSLSWTLNGLRSEVEIELLPAGQADRWEPLGAESAIQLSEKGKEKFLKHLHRVKTQLGSTDFFVVRSKNNFPSDAGIASSASSFAALTLAAAKIICQMKSSGPLEAKTLSDLSRQGSGSSCRSFFQPWSLWNNEGASSLELGINQLHHQVILVDSGHKAVSSSEAHVRCTTSDLFLGRKVRAENRLQELVTALKSQDWEKSFQLCWAEFWDMHALFETSKPAFGYLKPKSLEVLSLVGQLWQDQKDGPLVTLDAGPNVHFLWRLDQKNQMQKFQQQLSAYKIMTTPAGSEQAVSS